MLQTAHCRQLRASGDRVLWGGQDTQFQYGLTSIPSVGVMEVTLAQQDPWHSRWQNTVWVPASHNTLISQKSARPCGFQACAGERTNRHGVAGKHVSACAHLKQCR